MKKLIFFTAITMLSAISLQAQITKSLKQSLQLKMPKTAEDDMCGTRGAGVAWHPLQKKYFASFAGNAGYPMAIFDIAGKRLSDDDLATMVDTRGLWYNPVTKEICGNGYDVNGWFKYKLNARGLIADVVTLYDGMFQPSDQSVGAWHTAKKQAIFLKGSQVYLYNLKDTSINELTTIHWGIKKASDVSEEEDATIAPDFYNKTIIYTGMPNAELGFLNTVDSRVELYSEKTGLLSQVLKLPASATAQESFNFAYANGIYWLFDIAKRTWVGYK